MCSVNFSDGDDFFVVVLKLTLLIWDKPFHPLCWIHFNQCKVLFAVRYFKFNEYVRFCLIFNLRQNFLRIKIYFEELNMEKITYSEYYAVSVFSELGVHGPMFYVICYLFWDLVNPCARNRYGYSVGFTKIWWEGLFQQIRIRSMQIERAFVLLKGRHAIERVLSCFIMSAANCM